jgi:methylated-DNA-[protein]-cysteine S-methyltransferase
MAGMPHETFRVDRFETPVGDALLVTDEQGRLRALDWNDHQDRLERLLRRYYGKSASLVPGRAPDRVRKPLEAYFKGDLAQIDGIECSTAGTAFQRSVWAALRTIPAGTTLSYGALAVQVGSPKAVRAVGLANGANPVGLVVPCHRVIGSDGSLTGYGGGIERKRWLLMHEGASFRS